MSSLIQAIWDHHQSRFYWRVKDIPLVVCQSLDDDTTLTINFAETIGKVGGQKRKTTPNDFYWLPTSFNENTPEFRTKTLAPYFFKACQSAGFVICMKGWEKAQKHATFCCCRSRKHKPKRKENNASSKPDRREYKTKRAKAQEEVCKFRFSVQWNEEHSRWCVFKEQSGCAKHNGHLRDGQAVMEPTENDAENAFNFCLPIFQAATKNITTKEQLKRFTAALREAHTDVLALGAQSTVAAATASEKKEGEEKRDAPGKKRSRPTDSNEKG